MTELSDRATTWLNEAVRDLEAGRRTVTDLPAPLRDLWLVGFVDGAAAGREHVRVLTTQLTATEYDRDRIFTAQHPNHVARNYDAAAERHQYELDAPSRIFQTLLAATDPQKAAA